VTERIRVEVPVVADRVFRVELPDTPDSARAMRRARVVAARVYPPRGLGVAWSGRRAKLAHVPRRAERMAPCGHT